MTGFLRGVVTALVTPFTEDGVNFATLDALLSRQEREGADAVAVLGTTGEPSTMAAEEKEAVIRFARAHCGKMKLIVGTGGNDTSAAVKMTRLAADLGADGILAVTPYYNKCTQRGLIAYYRKLCAAVSLPVIAYNVPARTGVNLLPATMAELAEIPNMAGIKEASGNMAQVMETARRIRGKCDLYAGEDALALPILAAGGTAVISVVSNLFPAQVKRLTGLVFQGDLAAANRLNDVLLPLIGACFSEVNPIPVKAALALLGYDVGLPRAPLTELEPSHLELLKTALLTFEAEIGRCG